MLEALGPIGEHHELLMANRFAQSEALMLGKTRDEVIAEMRAAEQGAGVRGDRAGRGRMRGTPANAAPRT